MAKQPEITTIDNVETSEQNLNDNFSNIQSSFDNTLSRDGSTPNMMEAELDMNSNRIINLPSPTLIGDVVTLGYLEANVATSTPAVENKLKISSNDTTVGFLSEKISTTDGLSATITSPGADEVLELGLVITADSGLEEVASGLQVKDGEGIGVDTDGVQLDFPTLTVLAGASLSGDDTVAVYDDSASEHKVITITDLAANLPTAPDSDVTTKGLIETATVAEAEAGTDTERAVTPQGVHAAIDTKMQTLMLTYETTSGTSGSTTSNSYTKEPLNSIKINNISGASNSGGTVTLPAGTYKAQFGSVFYHADHCKVRLRNTTANSDLGFGFTGFMERGVGADEEARGTSVSEGVTYFTLASTSTVELQTRSDSTTNRTPANYGDNEMYAYLEITKVS